MSICNAGKLAALTVLLVLATAPLAAAVSKGIDQDDIASLLQGEDLEVDAAEADAVGVGAAKTAQDPTGAVAISAAGNMQSMQSSEAGGQGDPLQKQAGSGGSLESQPQADQRQQLVRRSTQDATPKMQMFPLRIDLLKFLAGVLLALIVICSVIGMATVLNGKHHVQRYSKDHASSSVTCYVERLELAEDGLPLKPKLRLQVKGCGIRAGMRGRETPKMPSEEAFPIAVKSYYSKADTPVNVIKNILDITQTASLQDLLLSMSDIQMDVIRLTGIDVVSECAGAEGIVHEFVGAGRVNGHVLEDWLDFRGYSMESVPQKGQGDQASQKLTIKAGPHSGGSVVRVVCYLNNLGFDCLLQLSENNTEPRPHSIKP